MMTKASRMYRDVVHGYYKAFYYSLGYAERGAYKR